MSSHGHATETGAPDEEAPPPWPVGGLLLLRLVRGGGGELQRLVGGAPSPGTNGRPGTSGSDLTLVATDRKDRYAESKYRFVMTDWAESTAHLEQFDTGEWETWVAWNDGTNDRRVHFRALREGENRCDLGDGHGGVCCLLEAHPGPHVPLGDQSAMPFVIAP